MKNTIVTKSEDDIFNDYLKKARKENHKKLVQEMEVEFGDTGSDSESDVEREKFDSHITREEYFNRAVDYFLRSIKSSPNIRNVSGDIILFIERVLSDEFIGEHIDIPIFIDKLTRSLRKNAKSIAQSEPESESEDKEREE